MNEYSKVALLAVTNYSFTKCPIEAWEKAAMKIFGDSTSGYKSCPKSTFLGLCENGLIKGIPNGKYTKSRLNKDYALRAIDLLKKKGQENQSPLELWRTIQNKEIRYNSQMDVVLVLWKNNLIN